MKKLMFLFIGIILALNINGQWYFNQYGVTDMNQLTESQLDLALTQSQKTIKTGKVLTFVGLGATIIGGVLYVKGIDDITSSTTYNQIDDGADKAIGGALLLYGGVCVASIGIPIWVVGDSRKNIVYIHLEKFKGLGYMPGLSIKIPIR